MAPGDELVLRQSSMLMDWDIDEKEHPVVLAKNVKKFEIEFWDERSKSGSMSGRRPISCRRWIKINLQIGRWSRRESRGMKSAGSWRYRRWGCPPPAGRAGEDHKNQP